MLSNKLRACSSFQTNFRWNWGILVSSLLILVIKLLISSVSVLIRLLGAVPCIMSPCTYLCKRIHQVPSYTGLEDPLHLLRLDRCKGVDVYNPVDTIWHLKKSLQQEPQRRHFLLRPPPSAGRRAEHRVSQSVQGPGLCPCQRDRRGDRGD